MLTLKPLRNALFGLMLACCTGAALANPSYHVVINPGLSGSGFLDLSFLAGQAGAPAASAVLSHFSGDFGSFVSQEGGVSGAMPGTVAFDNSGVYNNLLRAISLSGTLSFDIELSGAFQSATSNIGSSFTVGVLDSDYLSVAGGDNSALRFDLSSAYGGMPAGVAVTMSAFASASAVPEAPEAMLLVAGLALLGYRARRRTLG